MVIGSINAWKGDVSRDGPTTPCGLKVRKDWDIPCASAVSIGATGAPESKAQVSAAVV